MPDTLLSAVRGDTESHADAVRVACAPIKGVGAIRAIAPSELSFEITRTRDVLVPAGA